MAASRARTLPIEYLATTRLGEKGQITVPKEYCDALALDAGAPISVLRLGGSLLLVPEDMRFHQLCDRIASTFAQHGILEKGLLETLPEVRQRVFARHYPDLIPDKPTRKRSPRK
jgi:bifunctional DNA-binding transcriptional regulator/antitoxin component of YhaV-PrlF toxin-antitoxin module